MVRSVKKTNNGRHVDVKPMPTTKHSMTTMMMLIKENILLVKENMMLIRENMRLVNENMRLVKWRRRSSEV